MINEKHINFKDWELIYSALSFDAPEISREQTIHTLICRNDYDLKKLIKPIRKDKVLSKYCWKSCAIILASKNICDMPDDVIDGLFDWFQDLNWPGADIIFNYLMNNPCEKWIPSFERKIKQAINENDDEWLGFIQEFFFSVNLPESVFDDKKLYHYIKNWSYT